MAGGLRCSEAEGASGRGLFEALMMLAGNGIEMSGNRADYKGKIAKRVEPSHFKVAVTQNALDTTGVSA